MSDEPVYLDHAATTAVLPEVIEVVTEQLSRLGNPSSLHTLGRSARRVVEESRERIAAALEARPSEVLFTSGGTEADNLAVIGSHRARRAVDERRRAVLASTVEHHAVLDSVEQLVHHESAVPVWLEVGSDGRLDLDGAAAALAEHADDAAVLSVMWSNNEVGVVQPIAEVVALAHQHGIPVHTDAVQAVGHLPVSFAGSGVDLLSLTGHKLGGPVGVGALLARREASLAPLTYGGGQERAVRSGTVNVAGVAGLATAVELAVGRLEEQAQRLGALRDRLVAGAAELGLGIEVNGHYVPGDVTGRHPGNAHLRVPGCEGDSLLYLLDAAGVACSTGSACTAGVPRASHVLLAMGQDDATARGALRLSLGHTSTAADVDRLLAVLPEAVDRARAAAGAAKVS